MSILILSGCSTSTGKSPEIEEKLKTIEKENDMLVSKIKDLNKIIVDLSTELEEMSKEQGNTGIIINGITYYQVEDDEKKRFIPNRIDLLALPSMSDLKIRDVEENTLVTVHDKVSVQSNSDGDELWYYVSIPVYDTPMDYKGWIKVDETMAYDEETKVLLQNEVYVMEGTPIIESFTFPNLETAQEQILDYDLRGRLDIKQNGYVRLNCPGGMSCWVKEEHIVYPAIP